jgi:peptidoglycan hydrolase-like protein with peptidoglycan-binding domain
MNTSRSRGIVAHYPAAGRDIGVLTLAQEASRLRGWRNYHVTGRGWADLGYNYAIGQSGRIHTGRGLRVGAHATGHNSTTVGVLFIVGDNEELTQAARDAFKAHRTYLRKKGVGAGVWGHQQMSGASTRCPGPYIMGDIRAGRLSGGSGAAAPGGGGSTYKTVNATAPLGLYDKDPKTGHTRIADWQEDALGYTGKAADGKFGPNTDRDTRALQRQLGVKDDGLVGKDTMAAWEKARRPKLGDKSKGGGSKPKPAPKPSGNVPGPGHKFPWPKGHYIGPKENSNRSHSGFYDRTASGRTDRQWIKEFVTQLGRRGWNIGKGKTWLTRFGNDGLYGDELEALIRAFQKAQGLTVDGYGGIDVWNEAFHEPVT